ncbi:MAG TPA: hypothetical protein PKA10_13730 [Selenomonadales bacterium]|nr:hypothetical protein [Selenomonadales bacterium]
MNWPKITGYVGVTIISISFLARYCALIIPEPHAHAEIRDVLRWSQYISAYSVLVMGVYLARVLARPAELLLSVLAAAFSLIPVFGFFITVIYLFWAFAKLDREDNGLPF